MNSKNRGSKDKRISVENEVNKNICSHCQKVYDGYSETWLLCPACRIWFRETCFET